MFLLTGAYGRKYQTPESVQKDWEEHKDFYILKGSEWAYINRADWQNHNKGWDSVQFTDGTIRMVLEVGLM